MNSVAIIGNLTKDPELRHTPSGSTVCDLRVAVSDRYKDPSGEWTDRPFYFNVTCWNAMAENCVKWLNKGSKVGVTGKLTWREWEAQDGTKRQAVDILAFSVEFLTPKSDRSDNGGSRGSDDFEPAGVGGSVGGDDFQPEQSPVDDDIPF